MNEAGAAAPVTADTVGLFTAAHLAIIVILVILAIAVIWWGSRLRARQRPRDIEPPATTQRVATPAPVAPPVAPSPPPLADTETGALVEPAPAETVSAAPPVQAAGEAAQPVTMLKGLGPKVGARLGELGITTIGQIAALSPAEAEALDADLGTFRGRMARDRWIEQAQLLAAGDTARYEATFGKLG